jgi:hypothetical protein
MSAGLLLGAGQGAFYDAPERGFVGPRSGSEEATLERTYSNALTSLSLSDLSVHTVEVIFDGRHFQ